ncbi:MAG TPA: phosphotransferase family protein [Acetobacteraceae bacterium]|nr:phosphotransferase family protein [Acetobacteraceae bacterium]
MDLTTRPPATDIIDQPGSVRQGEELDVARVDAYLKGIEPGLTGTPELHQYPGGASNLTYLLRYPGQDLILRRPPFGHKAKSAHDMVREARIMHGLRPAYPYIPRIVAICEDEAVLGAQFYVMERLHGIIPRQDFPPSLALDPERTSRLCRNFFDKLIELHQVDYQAAGLGWIGKGEGYVQRQITGWNDRYRKARTPDQPDCEAIMAWLAAKMPARDTAICVIHNDYRLDNVVLDSADPLRIIGVLDWEMATLGDPLMDLGSTLAYWIQADDEPLYQDMRRQPSNAPGMLTRQEVLEYYSAKTGWSVASFDFYLIYGLFRLAAIGQQIYYRYYHGQTKVAQYAAFKETVPYLAARCERLIAESRL